MSLVQHRTAKFLIAKGNLVCIEAAEHLEYNGFQSRTLHLRNLSLKPNYLIAIIDFFKQEPESDTLIAISFSYNSSLGDKGAILLAQCLPLSISEIGLVACGMNDLGGYAILNWVKAAPNLRMICMEENHFSDELKKEFMAFKRNNTNVIIVF
jgi:hypothetical protein